jgi:hypothetical protein
MHKFIKHALICPTVLPHPSHLSSTLMQFLSQLPTPSQPCQPQAEGHVNCLPLCPHPSIIPPTRPIPLVHHFDALHCNNTAASSHQSLCLSAQLSQPGFFGPVHSQKRGQLAHSVSSQGPATICVCLVLHSFSVTLAFCSNMLHCKTFLRAEKRKVPE